MLKNGVVYIDSFVDGDPNTYSITSAIYNDPSGLSTSLDIAVDWIIFSPANDLNFNPLVGRFFRYRITSISNQDPNTGAFDANIIYDGPEGDEPGKPSNGTTCLISEPTSNNKIGTYFSLPDASANGNPVYLGAAVAALDEDIDKIIDRLNAYYPNATAFWGGTTPSKISNALDRLAAEFQKFGFPILDGSTSEAEFALENDLSTPTDVTGLVFDNTKEHYAEVEYLIERVTTGVGAEEYREHGTLKLIYFSSGWQRQRNFEFTDSGVGFTVTPGGQVKYTTTNVSGTPDVSRMKWRVRKISG